MSVTSPDPLCETPSVLLSSIHFSAHAGTRVHSTSCVSKMWALQGQVQRKRPQALRPLSGEQSRGWLLGREPAPPPASASGSRSGRAAGAPVGGWFACVLPAPRKGLAPCRPGDRGTCTASVSERVLPPGGGQTPPHPSPKRTPPCCCRRPRVPAGRAGLPACSAHGPFSAELEKELSRRPKKVCIVKVVGTRNLWKNIVVLCVNS